MRGGSRGVSPLVPGQHAVSVWSLLSRDFIGSFRSRSVRCGTQRCFCRFLVIRGLARPIGDQSRNLGLHALLIFVILFDDLSRPTTGSSRSLRGSMTVNLTLDVQVAFSGGT